MNCLITTLLLKANEGGINFALWLCSLGILLDTVPAILKLPTVSYVISLSVYKSLP